MKPPQEWEKNDLQALINDEVEESLTLDYKGAASIAKDDTAKDEISKDISAFANSAGGTLVYGMREKGHLPVAIEPIDSERFTREWLEQVIASRVEPRLTGVTIKPVRLSASTAAYVVVVNEGDRAYQARDRKYYRRFNFMNEPMHDYEIQLVMNRRRHPVLEPQLTLGFVNENNDAEEAPVSLRLVNSGSVIARLVYVELTCPGDISTNALTDLRKGAREHVTIDGVAYLRFKYHICNESGPVPLFPDTQHEVLMASGRSLNFRFPRHWTRLYGHLAVYCRVFADDARVHEVTWTVNDLAIPAGIGVARG